MPSALRYLPRVLAAASLLLATAACAPTGVQRAAKPVLQQPPSASPYARQAGGVPVVTESGCGLAGAGAQASATRLAARDLGDLRGDPRFDASALAPTARCWYEELWSVLNDPGKARDYTALAASNDLYRYSRDLNTHVNALLLALRVTGDLRLLDEVDRLAQHMAAALEDAWQGGYALQRGSIDGYLNWVWRAGTDAHHNGRDLHETDEMRTHGMLAQIAWALRANADLSSPNGVAYAQRADFWLDYLRNHFEAKWRERNAAPWPEMPFLARPHVHGTVDFVRYHHYLHLLTGEESYRREAERLSALLLDNMRVANTAGGPALVTPRSILALGGGEDYLLPATYARYVFGDAVDLHLEGVAGWASPEVPERLARTLAVFMLDGGDPVLARDVGGGVERAGIPPSSERSWSRVSAQQYAASPYAFLGPWDEGDAIARAALDVYSGLRSSERGVFIPVAMLLEAALAR